MKTRPLLILVLLLISFALLLGFWAVFPRTATIEFPGEGVYAGQIRGSTFHGHGTWTSEFGTVYEGDFRNGLFHGNGTMTFANGAQYIGEFKEGFMHGYGKMVFPDGHVHEGTWNADEFLGQECDECGHAH